MATGVALRKWKGKTHKHHVKMSIKQLLRLLSSRQSWALPYAIFAAVFVVLPLLLIVVFAFTDDSGAFSLGNFLKFTDHAEDVNTFVYSIGIAALTTLACILLGYPAAYILSRSKARYANTVVMLFILPMWVNILVRTLATVALFDFADIPLGEGALIFGMIYNFIPFMIYPIYNTLSKMDRSYIEAAQDLGASPAGIHENRAPALYAGRGKRNSYGVYAHNIHFCNIRTLDFKQHKALRYNDTGEH